MKRQKLKPLEIMRLAEMTVLMNKHKEELRNSVEVSLDGR